MAASRGVEIRVAAGLPVLLLDPASLELALLNLASNGIKYSDNARPSPFVEIAPGEAASGAIGIAVKDNGLGIPVEAQQEIFGRFVRAHNRKPL
jgi:two-component system, sensor histidine kinase and response regulator